MSLQRQAMIKEIIKDRMRTKFRSYKKPETDNMPFHYRLLGKDRMALFSFIQSLNTTFGISIYEPVAIALARERFKIAETQVKPFDKISSEAHQQIQIIMNELTVANREPNKSTEIEEIREVCQKGILNQIRLTKVDIWLENHEGELFLFDLKTVKPNKSDFEKFKRTLLEWTAAELAREPGAVVNAMIGLPYNPYEPEPYKRWTLRGMFDLQYDILIAEELWNFIGGEGTYKDLLKAFEDAGIELRPEIDNYFERFRENS
ncbi:TdeIII family type II restriction endonuclease [Candidatus Poribacteria bacterium]|nr:MAG: TdeIII family type II restriction endonuclease [Candidatus Poribacteria bacterium]